MIRCALAVLAAGAVLAGCGDGSTDAGGPSATVETYFLRDGTVWPVRVEVERSDDPFVTAVDALEAGPPADAADALGLESAIEDGTIDLIGFSVEGDFALATTAELEPEAAAQVVYTLTRLPRARRGVEIDGAIYTRDDFEEQTPPVLVEEPLAFDRVSSPLRARGTANTFEATFSFEILDADGEVLASDFVTATSGSGTRGTFRFEQPFVVEEEQEGTLRVFELSAEDGSRTNEVDIPIRLVP